MNIYISPENEKNLRQEASMSGLINQLLAEHYGSTPPLTKKTVVLEDKLENPVKKTRLAAATQRPSDMPTPEQVKDWYQDGDLKKPLKPEVVKAAVKQPTVCREHLVDKSICRLMKHTGKDNVR